MLCWRVIGFKNFWTWFGHDYFCGQFLSFLFFFIAATTWYSVFFLLSFVTRLHVTLSNLQKFGFKFHLRLSSSAFSGYGWSVDQLITSLLATACYTVLTRPNQVETAVHGCNSRLSVWIVYHVVVSLNFLRSISLVSLFSKKNPSLVFCLYKGIQRITRDYREFQGITGVLKAIKGIQRITGIYKKRQDHTRVCKDSQVINYNGIQGITEVYKGLQGDPHGFTGERCITGIIMG